ncbi:MAG: putative bifunctional diguanylate cyclase/phosphodiesterase [Prochlorothrix sp.]
MPLPQSPMLNLSSDPNGSAPQQQANVGAGPSAAQQQPEGAEQQHIADILIVDDTPANLRLLAALLSNHGYRVRKAINSKMAQLALETLIPDLILLDVRMPEMDGYELCRLLKADPRTEGIPIVFLSALGEALDKVQAFEAGGVDYITKPFEAEEVLVRIRTHLSLQNARKEIQALNAVLEQRVQERTQQLEAANRRLSELAHFDSLTGLPNRNYFIEILHQVQQQAQRQAEQGGDWTGQAPQPVSQQAPQQAPPPTSQATPTPQTIDPPAPGCAESRSTATETRSPQDPTAPSAPTPEPQPPSPQRLGIYPSCPTTTSTSETAVSPSFAVFFLDCDRFKIINNSLGHIAGDEVLVAVSQRLQETLRKDDVLARLGGDEFAVLARVVQGVEEATALASALIDAMSKPFWVHNHELFIGISIGIVMGHDRWDAPDDILRDADTAMYAAKRKGKGCHHLFSASMHKNALLRLQQENELRRAIEQQEFRLFYQPIVDLKTAQIKGFEALIRWYHPQRGIVSPNNFIPLAEEMGFINTIGWWVMEEGCRQLRSWWDHGLAQGMTLNLNLSAYQIQDSHLLEHIDRLMQFSQMPTSALKLEITETVFIENDRTIKTLHALKERGFQIALDDFGTGYSSLSYLHSLPIDILKVDKSFVQQIGDQHRQCNLVTAILGIAQTLNLAIVAEGIETLQQLTTLQALNCDLGQGYLFAAPLPAAKAEELLRNPVITFTTPQPSNLAT